MDIPQTARLLTLATTIDHQARTEDDVRAWQFVLSDLDYDDAVRGLRSHFRNPEHGAGFLKPAHIVAALAEKRASATSVPIPPRDPDEGMCRIHAGYPVDEDGLCDSCRRHPEDLRPGAPRPELVHVSVSDLRALVGAGLRDA